MRFTDQPLEHLLEQVYPLLRKPFPILPVHHLLGCIAQDLRYARAYVGNLLLLVVDRYYLVGILQQRVETLSGVFSLCYLGLQLLIAFLQLLMGHLHLLGALPQLLLILPEFTGHLLRLFQQGLRLGAYTKVEERAGHSLTHLLYEESLTRRERWANRGELHHTLQAFIGHQGH